VRSSISSLLQPFASLALIRQIRRIFLPDSKIVSLSPDKIKVKAGWNWVSI
jgi:hypothetical protein